MSMSMSIHGNGFELTMLLAFTTITTIGVLIILLIIFRGCITFWLYGILTFKYLLYSLFNNISFDLFFF